MHESLRKLWAMILTIGLLTVLLGIIILFLPGAAPEAKQHLIGIIILLGGIARAVYSYMSRKCSSCYLDVLLSIISIIVGCLILFHPLNNYMTFTTLLGMYFGVEGALLLGIATNLRQTSFFIWPTMNGIAALVLSLLIWFFVAGASLETIKILVALDFIFRGVVTSAGGLKAKNLKPSEPGTEPVKEAVQA